MAQRWPPSSQWCGRCWRKSWGWTRPPSTRTPRFVFEAQLGVDLSVQDIVGAETARDLAVLAHSLSAQPASDDDARLADLEHASDAELITLFQQLSTSTESSLSHAS